MLSFGGRRCNVKKRGKTEETVKTKRMCNEWLNNGDKNIKMHAAELVNFTTERDECPLFGLFKWFANMLKWFLFQERLL